MVTSKDTLLAQFQDAICSHQSIVEYRISCRDMLQSELVEIQNQNKIGMRIADIFDATYKIHSSLQIDPSIDDAEAECIRKAKLEKVIDDILLSDILDFEFIGNEEKTIRYTLKPEYREAKNDPKQTKKILERIKNKQFLYEQSILNCIVTLFESYLETIYQYLAILEPVQYFGTDNFPFHSLFNENLTRIVNEMIVKKIEDKMRDAIQALDTIKTNSKMRAYRKLCKPLLSDKINNGGFSYGEERKESHEAADRGTWDQGRCRRSGAGEGIDRRTNPGMHGRGTGR